MGVWIETITQTANGFVNEVTPCVGVWIETNVTIVCLPCCIVTPCVGVWIETRSLNVPTPPTMSHPAWVCGLKRQT